MAPDIGHTSDRDERFGELLATWLEAAEKGQTPLRDDWLARYPEFASELLQFLASEKLLGAITTRLREIPASGEATPAPADTGRPGGKPARADQELLGRVFADLVIAEYP